MAPQEPQLPAASSPSSSSSTTPTSPTTPVPSTTTTTLEGAAAAEELKWNGTLPIIHYTSIGVAVLGPIALALPGRGRGKLSVQNTILGSGTFWALNQLAYDYSGKSIYARSNERMASMFAMGDGLPEKARRNKELMEKERELRRKRAAAMLVDATATAAPPAQVVVDKVAEEEEKKEVVGRSEIVETALPEWKRKRLQEEREALAEGGKGYSGLIVDQVWEVWNQGLWGGGNKKEKDAGSPAGGDTTGGEEGKKN
ncbi:hypothetical protein B0H63DRAFT_479526 [Podospora didyma]|uniref:Uncharacterized protein n=1 Tax=Podospora didyma TaxID=330526 RepID=A0AAE0KL84_9PEZI|nr:hypothetical protein B0H63DRAFT_479526 [Podospora didyma]